MTTPLDRSRDLDNEALKANRERDAEEARTRDAEFKAREKE